MRVRFLRDFRSAATNETFYAKGAIADLDRGAEVVAEGAAEAVPLVAREGQAKPAEKELPFEVKAPEPRRVPRKRGR